MKAGKSVYKAYNPQMIISALMAVVPLAVAIEFAFEGVYVMCVVLGIIGLLSLFVLLTSPVYLLFSEKKLTIVYFWKCRETIPWEQVERVEDYSGWLFSRGDGFPHYTVVYPKGEDYRFFMLGDVPKTRRIARLFDEFYEEEPVDKSRRGQKKKKEKK